MYRCTLPFSNRNLFHILESIADVFAFWFLFYLQRITIYWQYWIRYTYNSFLLHKHSLIFFYYLLTHSFFTVTIFLISFLFLTCYHPLSYSLTFFLFSFLLSLYFLSVFRCFFPANRSFYIHLAFLSDIFVFLSFFSYPPPPPICCFVIIFSSVFLGFPLWCYFWGKYQLNTSM